MSSLPRVLRNFSRFSFCLALAGNPVAGAGFENGEAQANAVLVVGGVTTTAGEVLNLSAVSPRPSTPPPPPSLAPAVSTLNGTMSSVHLRSYGSITGTFSQIGSNGVSQVDFVDNLYVTAEGIATGTPLIVEVTWNASGIAEFSSTSTIKNRSKLLLEADGVQLDPDPNVPPPPKQQWTRDRSNFSAEHFDDFGPVTFEFLVEAGTPNFDGNLRLRAVVGFLVGGPGSIYSGNYSASGNADLTLAFVGATNVRTTDGQTLYKWSTNAQSGLVYGSRDDNPPSNPALTVGPSAGGPRFSTLSWDTVASEFYRVQASQDGAAWSTLTEVLGTGSRVSIDLINPGPATIYRLLTDLGSGHPAPAPHPPALQVEKNAAGQIIVAWPTNHWENYALNEIASNGSKTFLQFVQGNGGASWFAFPTTTPRRIFQVEAVLK